MKKCCVFLTGLAVGVVITALLTPKTGKDLQNDLIKKANDVQRKIKAFDIKDMNLKQTKEALKEKLDDVKKTIEAFNWAESKEKVQKKFEEVTERLSEIKSQLTEKLEDVAEATVEIVEEAKEEIAEIKAEEQH